MTVFRSSNRGTAPPIIDADIHAAYAAAQVLLDLPRLLAARSLRRDHDPAFLVSVAERAAAGDFTPIFDPLTYPRLGCSRCEVPANDDLAPGRTG